MPTPSSVHFDCLTADELAQDRLWHEIYEQAFPPNEREPLEVILDSLRKGVGLAFRARQDGATIGLATTHLLLNPAAVFLVYIAMSREHRGSGLGGALFERVTTESETCLRQRGLEGQGVVWEVDPPAQATESTERTVREQRMTFFERHGGVVLPRRYFQPPLDGGAPVEMSLMYRKTGATPAPDTEALVRAIYREKYGAINGIPTTALRDLL